MNIGIDIDDTLSNLYSLKKKVLFDYLKSKKLNTKLIDKNGYYLRDMYNWKDDAQFEEFWEYSHNKIFEDASVRKGAIKVINKLIKDGHKIYIVTARSSVRFSDPHGMSERWLNKKGIAFDKLIANRSDKENVCLENNIDIFIDDLWENLEKISNVGVKCLLLNNSQNKNFKSDDVVRVHSWKNALKHIELFNKKRIDTVK